MTILDFPSTILAIDGVDLGDFSCRALKMTLAPIEQQKQLHRTVNGTLVDWSSSRFRKFKATVKCDDQEAPILTDVWAGKPVSVLTLTELTGPDAVYMSMMVTGWSTERDEWGAQTSWTLELEEI